MYTTNQERALNLLALSGKVKRVSKPRFHANEVAYATGDWLEMQGFAMRMHTGNDAGFLVITDEGVTAAEELLADEEFSGE